VPLRGAITDSGSRQKWFNLLIYMARPARFELTTPAFGGQYSIQLSYGRGGRPDYLNGQPHATRGDSQVAVEIDGVRGRAESVIFFAGREIVDDGHHVRLAAGHVDVGDVLAVDDQQRHTVHVIAVHQVIGFCHVGLHGE
jgi:hypothetical protein